MNEGDVLTIEYKITDTFGWPTRANDSLGWMLTDVAEDDLKEKNGLGMLWYAATGTIEIVGTGDEALFRIACEFRKDKEFDDEQA